MLPGGTLEGLCRELVRRGWWVTAGEVCPETVLIGFNFLPHGHPTWLKAFEVPHAEATVEGVEHAVEAWREAVLRQLTFGGVSSTVRLMVAEHGLDKVREAMRARSFA